MGSLLIFITLIFALAHNTESHGNGAPENRCDTMLPGHWVAPQETLSPFEISVDKSIISPGDLVNITLKTVKGQPGFKGFLVMVKDGHEEKDKVNYGVFDLALSDSKNCQPVHCFDKMNSAMTHLENEEKQSVELYWLAPSIEQGSSFETEKELRVVATFVKDFWTIWTNVEPLETRLRLRLQPPMSSKLPDALLNSDNQGLFNENFPMRNQGSPHVLQDGKSGHSVNLDGNSSWEYFRRAWSTFVNMFASGVPN